MTEPLLAIAGLEKRFGAVVAAAGLDLEIAAGETHAVIGPNGAGKTTLLAQIAGEVAADAGRIRLAGTEISGLSIEARARLGIARAFQVPSLFPRFSAFENARLAALAHAGSGFRFWRSLEAERRLAAEARALLERVDLGGRADAIASALSHGEQRQLEIAMTLAGAPRLLLLDEPMAGLGAEEATRMLALLRRLKGRCAVLLVEHDMDAVFALADRVTVMVHGRVIACGPPAAVRADRAVREAYLGD